eukprot:SAG22_NODE_4260_length_1325_cov_1.235726_2_plen_112_part_01
MLANCALFTAEETAAGVKDGDKTEVRASFIGGFERKQFWAMLEQLKSDVQRTSRKWRRGAAGGNAPAASDAAGGGAGATGVPGSAMPPAPNAARDALAAEMAAELAKAKAAA